MRDGLIGRWLLSEAGIDRGYLRIVDDAVEEVCLGDPPSKSSKAIVLPAFVNAHTHVGDSVAFPAPKGSVEQLVAPPDGYKHRILRERKTSEKIDAMRNSIDLMARSGTCRFCDFREEGLEGVLALSSSLTDGYARPLVLGRPLSVDAPDSEIDALLASCDGFGMSALRDWPFDFLAGLSRKAKAVGKKFAIHASETVREDIDQVLELRPDFIVHMVKASQGDIAACVDVDVPVVVCPRSNEFFGLIPDIPRLIRMGVKLGLGTDNCMISRPTMIDEIQAAYRISSVNGGITPLDAVRLATYSGRKVLNAEGNITTEIGVKDDLVAIRVNGNDPLRELVTSARSEDITELIHGGKVWRSES